MLNTRRVTRALMGLCVVWALSQQSFAASIHSLGDQSPSGFSTNNVFFGNARGWRFTAGTSNLSVTELGIDPVTSGSYTLTLWDFAAQTILGQTTITNVIGGQWNWASLSSSVALQSGSSYLVMGIGNTPGATYYYNSGLPSSWYPTGDINYDEMRYCNSCTANTFPTNTLSGFQYGVVDIGYTNAVPEPASYLMIVAGLGLAGLVARQNKTAILQGLR